MLSPAEKATHTVELAAIKADIDALIATLNTGAVLATTAKLYALGTRATTEFISLAFDAADS